MVIVVLLLKGDWLIFVTIGYLSNMLLLRVLIFSDNPDIISFNSSSSLRVVCQVRFSIAWSGTGDFVRVGAGNSFVCSGIGASILWSGVGNSLVWSGVGASFLWSGVGASILSSGIGSTILRSGIGSSLLRSGIGSRILRSGIGSSILRSGVVISFSNSGESLMSITGLLVISGGPWSCSITFSSSGSVIWGVVT